MVDNVTLNTGSGGDTLAADDVGGAKHQRVKIEWGADGTVNETDAASGKGVPVQGEAAHDAPTTGNPILLGAEMDDTATDVVDEGDVGRLRINTRRALYVQLETTAGDDPWDDTNDALNVAVAVALPAGDNNIGNVDVASALPAGTNAIGKLAANSGVDIGDVDVTSISAGSNLIGDVGLSGARTSGGTTLKKYLDVDETEEEVKGTAGQVYWIHAMNLASAVRFLKIYNATAASVTVGTTVPDLTFPLPTQGDTNGAGFTLSIPNGIAFSTAITIAATTGIADNNSGAPGSNEVVVNLGYA